MPTEAITVLGFGLVLGLKHALDADHVIAVATIIGERKGILHSSIVGALWGIGHTAALLFMGFVVVMLGIQIPERLALGMEFAVAAMLVVLGLNVLWKLFRGDMLHVHVHSHHGRTHIHPHTHAFASEHQHKGDSSHHESRAEQLLTRALARMEQNKRSVMVGMIHGMAGSGALMLLVLATIPTPMLALTYIGVFGIGSICGMLVMSTLVGLPFVFAARRSRIVNRAVRAFAGSVSVVFGLALAWQTGVTGGLFIP